MTLKLIKYAAYGVVSLLSMQLNLNFTAIEALTLTWAQGHLA